MTDSNQDRYPERDLGRDQGRQERSTFWEAFLFFSLTLVLSGVGAYLMADYLWDLGWRSSSTALWFLFTILFGYLAFGFSHAFFGFILRRFKLPFAHMPKVDEEASTLQDFDTTPRVAIIIPVYNEPVDRVFAGIRAIIDSVMRTSRGDAFDFFILSDSNQPDQWAIEEAAWLKLLRDPKAQDRVFYRRRPNNYAKKSGNVADFCRTWGDHYRYMIVLDADSIMTGETLIELYQRMESNPRVALIQTSPALVNGESLFGRMQQFANRLYGPVFMEGLAFWQQNGGNFWGHNAILRLRPFMEHCDLPQLPGRKPFGGHILSHDFVEAGLLRRAGWEVWLAHDLEGSYEEGPQSLIDSAIRDRRWCQGNLQHSLLLFARGLRGKTRVHLANGILGYVASPLWLLFMTIAFWRGYTDGADAFVANGTGPQALAVFIITMVLLFAPKILCLVDLALDRPRRRAFGGFLNAATGAFVETLFSALIAPIMMLFHTRFVIWNIIGKTVGWNAQRRGAQGTSWDEAISVHGIQTLVGVGLGLFTAFTNFTLFAWLAPVLAGLWFSIPISVWTSRLELGMNAKREKLFLVPEESSPPREVVEAVNPPGEPDTRRFRGITAAVLDPFLNAVHVSLLRRNRRRLMTGQKVYGATAGAVLPTAGESRARRLLAEKLLCEGPQALDTAETLSVLSDIDNMLWLHRQAWLRPNKELAPWWQKAIRETSAAV
jgi:membrane glycosyltransferase